MFGDETALILLKPDDLDAALILSLFVWSQFRSFNEAEVFSSARKIGDCRMNTFAFISRLPI